MFKLVLVLSLCSIAAGCRQLKGSFGCESVLACLVSNGLDNSEKLSHCQKASAAVSCYDHVEARCDDQDLKSNITAQINRDISICPDEETSAEEDSECAKYSRKIDEHSDAVVDCVHTFSENKKQLALTSDTFSGHDASAVNVCPLLDQLYLCVLTKSTEICGNAYGSSTSRSFDQSYRSVFYGSECGFDARKARRSVENIFPLLSKTTKLKR
ncbi:uncharacterized protein LOC131950260 [Physella acuta]|uniref:uncharacterized protein LOC131950260 n=1 Tax=Physella acuta TaxID=109671 RepID=UPI0027DD589D|nr:uncharacterized protein LOC131950260 [Physella acuta]